jgi:predicted HTH domain antitoxin
MNTVSIHVSFPRDLLAALDVPEVQVEKRLRELIVVELVREDRISTGKGAELLGLSKGTFIQILGERGVDYFTESPEELAAQVEDLRRVLDANAI